VGNADSSFGEERGREDVVVVDAGAVGDLVSGPLKSAALGSAQERSKSGLLEGDRFLITIAKAEMILLSE
jgi:hypothetical protein